jgi:hypothetical protein
MAAAAVRSKLSRVAGGLTSTTSPPASPGDTDIYRILVTAGPSYDKADHQPVVVNSGQPVVVENEFVRAKIKVRVRAYRGLPSHSPAHSPYFDDPGHERDLYSIAFSLVPKQDLPSIDTVWGNDFDHPIREKLPPGFNTAFKIVKEFIDPALSCDAYADEPWLYGPSLTSWFAFRIGDVVCEDEVPFQEDEAPMKEGADGSGHDVRRKHNLPDTGDKRRLHFRNPTHREAFVFEKGRVYQGDFFNPYIDFVNRTLRLPGFTMKVTKYLEHKSHCLRYVFKNRQTGEVYFNINFNLLFGEDLEKAVKEDEEQRRAEELRTQMNGDGGKTEAQAEAGAEDKEVANEAGQSRPQTATSNGISSTAPKRAVEQDAATSGGKSEDTRPTRSRNHSHSNIMNMLRYTPSGPKQAPADGQKQREEDDELD